MNALAKKPDDPAFPVDLDIGDGLTASYPGMTIRDWFAGQALAGILANEQSRPLAMANLGDLDQAARQAYVAADAMLTVSSKGRG